MSKFKSNLFLFGELLYGYFWFLVIIVAIILLIAMFGSIILTLDSSSKMESKNNMEKYIFVKSKASNISF